MKIWCLFALAWGAMAASSAEAAVAVTVKSDHITCRIIPGPKRGKAEAVLSPDGHTVAYTRFAKSDDMPDGKAGSLWIGNCRTGTTHLLLPAPFAGKGDAEGWVTLNRPVFSLDGRQVYVSAFYGGDSGLVQRVDLATGHHAYVMAAELAGIIRTGPYRGDLLATRHTAVETGGSSYPYYVFSPQGAVVKRIAGSETWTEQARDAWLRRQGWQVR